MLIEQFFLKLVWCYGLQLVQHVKQNGLKLNYIKSAVHDIGFGTIGKAKNFIKCKQKGIANAVYANEWHVLIPMLCDLKYIV